MRKPRPKKLGCSSLVVDGDQLYFRSVFSNEVFLSRNITSVKTLRAFGKKLKEGKGGKNERGGRKFEVYWWGRKKGWCSIRVYHLRAYWEVSRSVGLNRRDAERLGTWLLRVADYWEAKLRG